MASTQDLLPPHPLPKLLVLISGSGTNLQALIDATAADPPKLRAKITHVISNRKNAYGLTRAKDAGISTSYHNLVPYLNKRKDSNGELSEEGRAKAREEYDARLAELILENKPDMIVCAGWMHILSSEFLLPLEKAGIPIINLHPALPGEYDGAGAIERAWKDAQEGKIKRTGVMIHYVIREVDRGEPIVVREVEIKEGDTLEELETRIHGVEHEAIVEGAAIALQRKGWH